ncbi:alternative splicing regulator-domain-containing protein [Thamnidium elegans]|nr:alternative splicing regulator-domain-containing protein [Thamnidium elegans]
MIPKSILFQRHILYAHLAAKTNKPTLCFIPGFRSDFISSKKSIAIYQYALQHGLGFLSWNHNPEGSVIDWFHDGLTLLQHISLKQHYFIGASMGLWISLLLSPKTLPQGILGIGGGVDFTERWLINEVPAKEQSNPNYIWQRPSLYDPKGYYEIPVSFLLNSRPALIMSKPIDNITCPVYLIHGALDHDVPIDISKELYHHLSASLPRVSFDLIQDGDHQLSRSQDLDFIKNNINIYKKKIKELMVDHRKRAERRRAYYESRLGDIQQLIRVIGVSSKVYPDAEQFYYHENPDNLMNWQGNQDIKIDRFDGRSLLDFVPDASRGYGNIPKEEREMQDELNFERYHDLIEAERLNADRLAEVDEEWTKLLDRHQAKLALINSQEKGSNTKSRGFGFDYGTTKVKEEDLEDDTESQLLKDILFFFKKKKKTLTLFHCYYFFVLNC